MGIRNETYSGSSKAAHRGIKTVEGSVMCSVVSEGVSDGRAKASPTMMLPRIFMQGGAGEEQCAVETCGTVTGLRVCIHVSKNWNVAKEAPPSHKDSTTQARVLTRTAGIRSQRQVQHLSQGTHWREATYADTE